MERMARMKMNMIPRSTTSDARGTMLGGLSSSSLAACGGTNNKKGVWFEI